MAHLHIKYELWNLSFIFTWYKTTCKYGHFQQEHLQAIFLSQSVFLSVCLSLSLSVSLCLSLSLSLSLIFPTNCLHSKNNPLCAVEITKSTWTQITFDLRLQSPTCRRVQSSQTKTHYSNSGLQNKLDTSRIGQIYQRQCQNQ